MMKRITAMLLALVLALGVLPVTARAEEYSLGSVNVNFAGVATRKEVLLSPYDEVYAPLSWLTFFGADMEREDLGDEWAFYNQEEGNFAQRIFINKKDGSFAIALYFDSELWAKFVLETADYGSMAEKSLLRVAREEMLDELLEDYFSRGDTEIRRLHGNYLPITEGTFSDVVERDGEIWVPIGELLPMLQAEISVTEEGDLMMSPVVTTLTRVLHEHWDSIEELLFDADDVEYGEVVTTGAFVVDTAFDAVVDPLDVVTNVGRVHDYEDLFKKYLVDNEAYLSLFSEENSVTLGHLKTYAKVAKNFDTIYDFVEDCFDLTKYAETLKEIDPEVAENFSKYLPGFGDALSEAASLMEYSNIYLNQVEDHRLMLEAVYDYEYFNGSKSRAKEIEGWPSYNASLTVRELYDTDAEDCNAMFLRTVSNELKDYAEDKLPDPSGVAVPWYLAIKLTKMFREAELEYMDAAGKMGLVDNTVSYSMKIAEDRLFSRDFGTTNFNGLRLCLMMAVLGSRYAYSSYWTGDMKKEELERTNEILKDLYLAGIWSDYGSGGTYDERLFVLKQELESLRFLRQPSGGLEKLEYAIVLAALQDMDLLSLSWTLNDADGDGNQELLMTALDPESFRESQLVLDADAMVFDSHTALGAYQLSEFVCTDDQSGWVLSHGGASAMNGGQFYYRWDGGSWLLYNGIEWSVEEEEDGSLVRNETLYTDGEVTDEGSFPFDGFDYQLPFDEPYWEYPVWDDPDLSDFRIDGKTGELMAVVHDYLLQRQGFLKWEKADIDGDGDDDRLYALVQAGEMWFDWAQGLKSGSEQWLNFQDTAVTLVAMEQTPDGVRLRTVRLDMSHLTLEQLMNLDKNWSLDGETLTIGGETYIYQSEGPLYLTEAEQRAQETADTSSFGGFTIEGALAEQMDILIDSYPDPGNMNWGESHLGGETIELGYDSQGLYLLRINHTDGGSVPITDTVSSDTTINDLMMSLPNAMFWDGPYEVYGFESTPEWYAYYCDWTNSLDGSVWSVTVTSKTDNGNEPVSSITFYRQ